MRPPRSARTVASRPIRTKRLVAHRPPGAVTDRGPAHGDPVWLPAPCARLRAGYTCECGDGFEFKAGYPDAWSFARVEAINNHEPTRYQEEQWVYGDRHGRIERDDDDRLTEQIEALEVGTIVERHGLGIAPLFEPFEEQDGHEPLWMLDLRCPN